jgi:hydroxypyruvate isomerase
VNSKVTDPKAFLAEMKKIGYQGVELLPETLYDTARAAGMTIVSTGIGGIEKGLNRIEHHDRIEAELKKALVQAKEYGLPNIIVFSGNRDGLDDDTGARNTIAGLKRLAPLAEAAGVTLILELLNSKVDHKDYQCDHTAWGVNVVKTVASPRVKLLYDIYHMQIMEGDVIRTLRESVPFIGHIHTAGVPGRNDLDMTQELNYPPIIQALSTAGYTGWVGQEFVPRGEPLPALRAAFDLCTVG